ncbi:MAG: hypothetical protein AAF734_02965, partial [Bacteroidota bacterium]
MSKKIIYVDMDNVLANYTTLFKERLQQQPEITYPQSQYGFFSSLLPMKQAIESVNLLAKQTFFDVYILTAPSIYNPLSYTEKRVWVEKRLGMSFVEKLIICPNKGLCKGDYLIDDNTMGSGQDHFEGRLIHFGSEEFIDWQAVVEYFRTHYALAE